MKHAQLVQELLKTNVFHVILIKIEVLIIQNVNAVLDLII